MKIDIDDLNPIVLGDSDDLIIGEWVVALGNPLGLFTLSNHVSATAGIISAMNMDFGKKEDRTKYLEEKFDNLLDVIGESYGNVLMEELISRLDVTIDEFNQEISNLFNSLKEKELERQSLLKGISVKKKKNKKKTDLTEWEQKLKQIEESK